MDPNDFPDSDDEFDYDINAPSSTQQTARKIVVFFFILFIHLFIMSTKIPVFTEYSI